MDQEKRTAVVLRAAKNCLKVLQGTEKRYVEQISGLGQKLGEIRTEIAEVTEALKTPKQEEAEASLQEPPEPDAEAAAE